MSDIAMASGDAVNGTVVVYCVDGVDGEDVTHEPQNLVNAFLPKRIVTWSVPRGPFSILLKEGAPPEHPVHAHLAVPSGYIYIGSSHHLPKSVPKDPGVQLEGMVVMVEPGAYEVAVRRREGENFEVWLSMVESLPETQYPAVVRP